jgi:hypothetical protein
LIWDDVDDFSILSSSTLLLPYYATLLYSTLLVMHASPLFYFLSDICLLMKTLRPLYIA